MLPPALDVISVRTFSSVWYWIAVAAVWSLASHRPMGVPYDMVWRARREGSRARCELDAVAQALARRLVEGVESGGVIPAALVSAALTALVLMALLYGVELAQGMMLLALPLAVTAWLTLLAARAIAAGGDAVRHLRRLRGSIHAIALVALFVTAFWGMYVNLAAPAL